LKIVCGWRKREMKRDVFRGNKEGTYVTLATIFC